MKYVDIKNKIAGALILCLVSLSYSCKDSELLDLNTKRALSETTAFTTIERIELAMVGVYDAANTGFYVGGLASGNSRGYPFGAAHVELGDMRGEDALSTQGFYGITYEGSYDATTPNNDFYWQTLWALINRANVVLDGLGKVVISTSITQSKVDEYKGECLFLRALAYHELMKNFARPYSDNPTGANSGMPIRTAAVVGGSTVDNALSVGRSTIAETYDFMIGDLNQAEGFLPATRAGGVKITRATKGAAIALKTRIYLHRGDYTKVIEEANKLVPTSAPFVSPIGAYQLTASPYGPFGSGNKNNVESIFSIENSSTDNPTVNGALPQMYSPSAAPINGRGLVAISPILWNNTWFLANDLRKSSLMVQSDPGSSGKNSRMTTKYSDVTGRSDNAPVIRYAEVLLNLAEAIQRQAGASDTRALALLNEVRNRSVTNVADQFTLASASVDTKDELILAVLRERRIEFVCEGLRWGDIHRLMQDPTFGTNGIPAKCSRNITSYAVLYTGLPSTTFATHAFIPYTDKRILWPIPNSEVSVNIVLAGQQNPGW